MISLRETLRTPFFVAMVTGCPVQAVLHICLLVVIASAMPSLARCLQELDEAEAIGLDDALKMQVKRYMLEKWVNEPFFEATLTGCLVRLSFHKGYLACEITGIEERPPGKYRYSSGSRKETSAKNVLCCTAYGQDFTASSEDCAVGAVMVQQGSRIRWTGIKTCLRIERCTYRACDLSRRAQMNVRL